MNVVVCGFPSQEISGICGIGRIVILQSILNTFDLVIVSPHLHLDIQSDRLPSIIPTLTFFGL